MLNTKKRGSYKIITFAVRGELLKWLLSKPKLSEFIRETLIKQMEKEKKSIAINSVLKDMEKEKRVKK